MREEEDVREVDHLLDANQSSLLFVNKTIQMDQNDEKSSERSSGIDRTNTNVDVKKLMKLPI